jgi:hypothetical protein
MTEKKQELEQVAEGEITLKQLIFTIREYFVEVLRNWKIVLLFVFPFLAYQCYLRFTKAPDYSALITFMVNDTKGSSISGMLGQFGGLIGTDDNKLDKILELGKSRRTLADAIFTKATIDGKEDYFANHLIRLHGLHKQWERDTMLRDFVFTKTNEAQFSIKENLALRNLHKLLIGSESTDPIFTTSANKKTGIMAFNLKTKSPELSISLLKQIFASLSNFYIESTIRKEKDSWQVLVDKRDSIARVLNYNDVSSARHDDQNNSLLFQVDKVPAKRYSRNNLVLTSLYGEIVKNTELAEFALKTATPYITAIDEPIPPIRPAFKGKLSDMIIYSILGAVVGIFYILARYIYRKAINS